MRANFALFIDGLRYHVSERAGTKAEYQQLEHFVAFFETEAAAYEEAIRRTRWNLDRLNSYVKEYQRRCLKLKRSR